MTRLTFLLLFSFPLLGQSLPDAPSFSRKAFAAYSAADIALMSADMALSAHYLSPRTSICRELDPIYGYKPSPARFWITGSAILLGEQILSWELRKQHKDWWMLPMLTDGLLHGIGALSGPHGACLK